MPVAETPESGALRYTGWVSVCNRMSPDRGEGMSGAPGRAEFRRVCPGGKLET